MGITNSWMSIAASEPARAVRDRPTDVPPTEGHRDPVIRGDDARVPLVVAVTGHRDLVPAEIAGLRDRVRGFLTGLRNDHPDLPLVLMSPLAEGADRLVAEEARALGIPLIVPLPFPVAIYERDFETPASLQAFREFCLDAEVIELPLLPGDTPESVAEPGPRRDLHYARLGIYLCAHCHVLLALWDGKPSARVGGTAQVVQFHHWDRMLGFAGHSEALPQMLADDESDLVYHVVCSRDRPGGEPAEGLEPLDAWWFTTDTGVPRTLDLPEDYRLVLERMSEFNRDAIRFDDAIRTASWPLVTEGAPAEAAEVGAPIDAAFRTADWLAIRYQDLTVRALRASYASIVLMGLAFVIYGDLYGNEWLILAFLLFFAMAAVVHHIARRRAWHRKYLDYRALAEGLRVQFYWVSAGLTSGRATKFAHDNFLQSQDVELGWIRHVMRYAGRLGDIAGQTPVGLDFAVREWIDDPRTGQLAYYERKATERIGLSRRTATITLGCLLTGIAVAILLALVSDRVPRLWTDLLFVLMGILPLIAGVRQAYAQKRAENELIKQYLFMASIFRNAHRRLRDADSDAARRRILKALGDAALEEHAQWILIHRERSLEAGDLRA
jgi:hypothetical protein